MSDARLAPLRVAVARMREALSRGGVMAGVGFIPERARMKAPCVRRLAAAALLVVAGTAAAETLPQAWQQAIAHNQMLAAARADVQGARDRERAARDARWPSVSARAGYTHFGQSPQLDVVTPALAFRSGPIFKHDQYVSGSVQMRIPLYTGGAIRAGINAARAGVAGASAQERAALEDLKLAVAEAYVSVLRARRRVAVADAAVGSLNSHLRDVRKKFARQLVARSDLLAAEVALADAKQSRVSAADAMQVARARYNRLLGEPLGRVPRLAEGLPAYPLDAQPLASLLRRALASRAELTALASRAGALASKARAESASRLPQLSAVGGFTHFDNQILNRENFSTVGVGLTWKLFDGGQAASEADALRAESRAAARRLRDLRSRIELQVRSAWLALASARARVYAARAATAEAAENLRDSRELYGAGLASDTRVLEAVTLKTRAAENHNDAVLDEALAKLKLAYAVGAL